MQQKGHWAFCFSSRCKSYVRFQADLVWLFWEYLISIPVSLLLRHWHGSRLGLVDGCCKMALGHEKLRFCLDWKLPCVLFLLFVFTFLAIISFMVMLPNQELGIMHSLLNFKSSLTTCFVPNCAASLIWTWMLLGKQIIIVWWREERPSSGDSKEPFSLVAGKT